MGWRGGAKNWQKSAVLRGPTLLPGFPPSLPPHNDEFEDLHPTAHEGTHCTDRQ